MKKIALSCSVLVLVSFCVWYGIAANYGYDALSGAYVLNQNGERCTLFLRSDGTFTEQVTRNGISNTVEGSWRRYGEAHVSFSSSFLKLDGEELNAEGEAHGQFDRTFGLFPSLTLAPIPGGPMLKKRLLSIGIGHHGKAR